MTYVIDAHTYNEGGVLSDMREDSVVSALNTPFTDLGILTLLIASVLEAKPFGAHAEDCIQLQAGEGD